jgi:hypothetical protein
VSRKLENELAERLYKLSLDGGADAEVAHELYGYYALFAEFGTILYEDTDGNVFLEQGDDEYIARAWADRQADYDEWADDQEDDDYWDDYALSDYDGYEED